MGSPELRYRIDLALSTLWNESKPAATVEENSEVSTFTELYRVYCAELTRNYNKFINSQVLTNGFPSSLQVARSKVLNDDMLIEAVIYSKVFHNYRDFDENRGQYKADLVWVKQAPEFGTLPGSSSQISGTLETYSRPIGPMTMSAASIPGMYEPSGYSSRYPYQSRSGSKSAQNFMLISQNQIIYHIGEQQFTTIREAAQKVWSILKPKVSSSLVKTLTSPELGPNWATPDVAAGGAAPVRYPMTEEVKKYMLQELDELHVDCRVKQRFIFDLKVLPDKDILYWRDRLDCLRFSATSALIGSPGQRLQEQYRSISGLEEKIRKELDSINKRLTGRTEAGQKLASVAGTSAGGALEAGQIQVEAEVRTLEDSSVYEILDDITDEYKDDSEPVKRRKKKHSHTHQ